jgi:hypothetical protein
MDSQVLEPKKQELEDFIQGNPDAREVKRALAVKWSLSGSYRQIRKLLNVYLGFISKDTKNSPLESERAKNRLPREA